MQIPIQNPAAMCKGHRLHQPRSQFDPGLKRWCSFRDPFFQPLIFMGDGHDEGTRACPENGGADLEQREESGVIEACDAVSIYTDTSDIIVVQVRLKHFKQDAFPGTFSFRDEEVMGLILEAFKQSEIGEKITCARSAKPMHLAAALNSRNSSCRSESSFAETNGANIS